KEVKKDIVFDKFLKRQLKGDRYTKLRDAVKRFVEGYDAADSGKASTIAFREEWMESDEKKQFWPEGGYGALVDHTVSVIKKSGGSISLRCVVTRIVHRKGEATVYTKMNTYKASKVIVTVPPPVLLSGNLKDGRITF